MRAAADSSAKEVLVRGSDLVRCGASVLWGGLLAAGASLVASFGIGPLAGVFLGERVRRSFLLAWDVDAWYAMITAFLAGAALVLVAFRNGRVMGDSSMRRYFRAAMVILGFVGSAVTRIGYFSAIALSRGSPLILPVYWLVVPLALFLASLCLSLSRCKNLLSRSLTSDDWRWEAEMWLGLLGASGFLVLFRIVRAGELFDEEVVRQFLSSSGLMIDLVFFAGVSALVVLILRLIRKCKDAA
jgi:hypothetical protein